MVNVKLYSVPAPGQCKKGEDRFLGTVRTNVHKASLTALTAGLEERLEEAGVCSNVGVIDMQTLNANKEKYGEINYGGLLLEKYRVGSSFSEVNDSIKDSDVIGINANFTHSRIIVIDFMKYAKQRNKNPLLVVGGTDATADPEYYLRNGADIVVKGEGELVLQGIVKRLYNGGDLQEIPNISYNDNGVIRHNLNLFLLDQFDVNSMPPPNLDIVDISKYTDTGEGNPPHGIKSPFISVETSRGCAQTCSFCATPTTKGRYRFMGVENIKKHLEYFKRKGIETILFQEDNMLSRVHRSLDGEYSFPKGREELLEMFRLVREMEFSWEFANGLEFGRYEYGGKIDYELMEAMFWHQLENEKTKGCYRATIPLENLTDENSRLFKKLKPIEKSKEIIRAIAQTGINTVSFNIIIGRPQDDECNLRLSYERCLEMRDIIEKTGNGTITYFNIYALSLLPGTIDYRRYKDLLAFDLEQDPELITFYLGSLKTEHFSPLEITQARGTLSKTLNHGNLIKDFDETSYITSERFEKIFT